MKSARVPAAGAPGRPAGGGGGAGPRRIPGLEPRLRMIVLGLGRAKAQLNSSPAAMDALLPWTAMRTWAPSDDLATSRSGLQAEQGEQSAPLLDPACSWNSPGALPGSQPME